MDLEARKYNFIQELFNIDKEKIMTTLERVLKREKEEHQEISTPIIMRHLTYPPMTMTKVRDLLNN